MAVVSFPARNRLAYPSGFRPGFDPSHPAAFGNVLSVVNSGSNFVNLSGGVGQRAGSVQGAPAQGIQGLIGPSMNFQGVSDQVQFLGMPTKDQVVMTAAAICMFTAAAGGQNQFLISCDGAANGGLLIGVNNGSVNFGCNYSAASNNSSLPVVVNVPYFYAVSVVNSGTATFVVKRLDTGQVTWDSVAVAGSTGGDGNWAISGRQGATGRQALAYIAAGMASYTALSLPQLRQWAEDPWAFWNPPQAKSRIAGAAATFLAAWASQTNLPVLGTGTY